MIMSVLKSEELRLIKLQEEYLLMTLIEEGMYAVLDSLLHCRNLLRHCLFCHYLRHAQQGTKDTGKENLLIHVCL